MFAQELVDVLQRDLAEGDLEFEAPFILPDTELLMHRFLAEPLNPCLMSVAFLFSSPYFCDLWRVA